MQKINLTKQFAIRLKEAMLKSGLGSQRSASGVCINKLAEMLDCSPQICRRYLRGEALPEPTKLMELASKLKVSAGWLLFGDNHFNEPISNDYLFINKKLLHYLFCHIENLHTSVLDKTKIPNFLLELINNLALINATEEQSKQIIDLALASLKHFEPKKPE